MCTVLYYKVKSCIQLKAITWCLEIGRALNFNYSIAFSNRETNRVQTNVLQTLSSEFAPSADSEQSGPPPGPIKSTRSASK